MSKSYFPTERAGQIDWHNNFAREFPKLGKNLGFSEAEVTNAVNDSKYAAYLLETLGPEIDSDPAHAANAVLDGQASGEFVDLPTKSNAPPAVRPGVDTRRQARAERIKAHANYSDDIGQQLQIVPGTKFDPNSYRAELGQARQTAPNMITIPFRKAGGEVDGINLYRQRKGEGEPQLVGFFMRTPAVDTVPIASAGTAEERTYTARAVVEYEEIGKFSDAVRVSAR